VLVHGWSVKNTDTYGALPGRLKEMAEEQGLDIDIHNIWLGKYVSFHDEVRVWDISRAFEKALADALGNDFSSRPFACITHSTGGPMVREWWQHFYIDKHRACPMGHLIMLAPANFGSALAQLGKGTLSRIKFFFDGGVEPGTGVLDWLELGSSDAFTLNRQWMKQPPPWKESQPVFPFVLTGQCIDHAFYDHVNNYTGELGSDGVVRVAAANLNSSYVKLVQKETKSKMMMIRGKRQKVSHGVLSEETYVESRGNAFRLVGNRSHSNKKMGIMRSIGLTEPDYSLIEIIRCLKVGSPAEYSSLVQAFEQENRDIEQKEILDVDEKIFIKDHVRIRDRYSMFIVRVWDEHQRPVNDYDFLFTGEKNDPNKLPPGFVADRQKNTLSPNTMTFFLNHTLLTGCDEVTYKGHMIRRAMPGIKELGIKIIPHQLDGFAHYAIAEYTASNKIMDKHIKPHQTMMIDIELKRIVHENTTRLTTNTKPENFGGIKPGEAIEPENQP
jgi:hypothetical protein